ncbi:MAG: hypothetical protein ACE145_11840 [Terriglobia bacterium]
MSRSCHTQWDRGASSLRVFVVSLFLALAVYGYLTWQAYEYRAKRDEVLQLMKDVYSQCLAGPRDDPRLAQRIEITKSAIYSLKPEDRFGLLVVFEAELASKGCNPEPPSPTRQSAEKQNRPAER